MSERTPMLKEGERLDDLQLKSLKIIQNSKGFCFGIDAVLLSAYAQVKPKERVLDLGTGTGVIPILLSGKTQGEHFTGLEINPDSADMARRSAAYNHLEDKVSIVTGDICKAGEEFAAGSFDVVTSNPPYMTGGHGLVNPDPMLAAARHELKCTFDDVARSASAMLKERGRFYLVHRPFRLPELMATLMTYRLEPKSMRLVYPSVDKEPSMVLLGCMKGGKPRCSVEKPLIIYDETGQYTPEVKALYHMVEAKEQAT